MFIEFEVRGMGRRLIHVDTIVLISPHKDQPGLASVLRIHPGLEEEDTSVSEEIIVNEPYDRVKMRLNKMNLLLWDADLGGTSNA